MYKSKFTGQEIDDNLTKINNINVNQINEDIETLKTQTQTNTTDITGLTTKTNDLQTQVSGIATQVAGQQTQITNLQDNKLDNSNGVITSNLLADGSITSTKIAEHQVTDEKLEVTTLNKINKALQAPTTAPTSTELVGIDTNNTQVNIGIGSGLSLENGTLKATGGGGGGDGGANVTQEVLWTDPNPNQFFQPQSVTLSDNYTNYDILIFTFKNSNYGEIYQYTFYTKNANNGTIVVVDNNNGEYSTPNWYGRRHFTLNENVCTFTQGAANVAIANDIAKPIQIIGLKFLDTLNYSTEEQYTGKHWIDGKKIYQKTYYIGDMSTSEIRIDSGIVVDRIINISGNGRLTDGIYQNIPSINPYYSEQQNSLIFYDSVNNKIGYQCGTNIFRDVYITLQYTKTTE